MVLAQQVGDRLNLCVFEVGCDFQRKRDVFSVFVGKARLFQLKAAEQGVERIILL